MKIGLFLIIIGFTSCNSIIQETIGRKAVSTQYPVIMIPDTAITLTVPFIFIHGIPCVTVKINDIDSTFQFIFDTGSFTYISDKIVESKNDHYQKIYDSNNEESNFSVVELSKVYLGNYCFEKVQTKVLKNFVLENVDGVLGVDFMIGKVFYFDFKNQLVTISNKRIVVDKNKRKVYDARFIKSWDKRFYLHTEIFNSTEKLFFDTGCNTFIYLNDKNVKGSKASKSYLKQSQGAFSSSYVIRNYYDIDSLRLFNMQMHNLTIQSNEKNVFGAGIFSKMDVKIDFIKNRLSFYNNIDNLYFEKETPNVDIVLAWDNFLYIKEIEVDAFSQTQLLPGDKIISIDNKKVPDNLNDLKLFIKNKTIKNTYVFDIQRRDSIFRCEVFRELLIQKR